MEVSSFQGSGLEVFHNTQRSNFDDRLRRCPQFKCVLIFHCHSVCIYIPRVLLQLSCEGQFDHNLSFRAELKRLDLVSDEPIGVDHYGHRYWLLQVHMYIHVNKLTFSGVH